MKSTDNTLRAHLAGKFYKALFLLAVALPLALPTLLKAQTAGAGAITTVETGMGAGASRRIGRGAAGLVGRSCVPESGPRCGPFELAGNRVAASAPFEDACGAITIPDFVFACP